LEQNRHKGDHGQKKKELRERTGGGLLGGVGGMKIGLRAFTLNAKLFGGT